MRRIAVALALCGALFCSPASAKTFVAVLWPMFGPLPAIGLVELVGELKLMPDVEVSTYLHQSWPSLVEDIERQPTGTRTVVVGYSLGANATAFVANKTKYIDVIIALQPSMLSWNPPVTGQVGRMIEIYNPNPLMTFGGMGSKKLIGPNIEYIANNDSHPGAQFNLEFRDLVKSEITRMSSEPAVVTAQARISIPPKADNPPSATLLAFAKEQSESSSANRPAKLAPVKQLPALSNGSGVPKLANVKSQSEPARAQEPAKLAVVKQQASIHRPQDATALLDNLTSTIDSGNLFVARQLTVADMIDYANRSYGTSRTAEAIPDSYQYR